MAKKILKHPSTSDAATLIALCGELGTGKTTFAQGFLRGSGWRGRVTSPTFILMKKFPLHNKNYEAVYHVDAYRLRLADADRLGLKKILVESKNIVLIEWPERLGQHIPRRAIMVNFKHGKNENERTIKIKS